MQESVFSKIEIRNSSSNSVQDIKMEDGQQDDEMEQLKAKVSQMEKINASQSASHDSQEEVWNNSMEEMQEASARMVSKLEQDVLARDTEISLVKEENSSLTAEVEKVRMELQMLHAVSDILPQKVEELTKELNDEKQVDEENITMINDLQAKCTAFEQEIERKQNEYELEKAQENESLGLKLKAQSDAHEEELKKRDIEKDELVRSVTEFKTQNEAFEQEIERKQNEYELEKAQESESLGLKLKAQSDAHEEELKKIEIEKDELVKSVTELKTQNEELEESLKNSERSLQESVAQDDMRASLEQVQLQLADMKDLEEKIGDLEKAYDDALVESEGLKVQNKSLSSQNEEIAMKIVEMEEQIAQGQENLIKAEEMKIQLESLESDAKQWNEYQLNQSKESSNVVSPEEIENLRNTAQLLQSEKEDLEAKIEEINDTLSSTKEKLAFTSDDNLALIGNFSKLESQFKAMRDERDYMSTTNEELTKKVHELNENLATGKKELDESKEGKTYLEEKHMAFKKAYGAEINGVKQELKSTKAKFKKNEELVQTLKNDKEALEAELQELRGKSEDIHNGKDGVSLTTGALETENEQLKNAVLQLKEELEKASSNKEGEDTDLQSKIESVQLKNDKIIEDLKMEVEKMNANLDEEVAALTSRYEEELYKVKESNLSLKSQLEAGNETPNSVGVNNELQAKIDSLVESEARLKGDMKVLQKRLNEEEFIRDVLETDLSSSDETLQTLEKDLTKSYKELQKELYKLKKKNESLIESESKLKETISTKDHAVSEMTEKIAKLQDQLQKPQRSVKIDISDTDSKHKQSQPTQILKEELAHAKKTIKKINASNKATIKQLTASNSALKRENASMKRIISKKPTPIKLFKSSAVVDGKSKENHNHVQPLGAAAAALIGTLLNADGTDLIIPQENEEVKKPPALIDFMDAVNSDNWKEIDLSVVTENALRKYLDIDSNEEVITYDSLQLSSVQEFSSVKKFWYAKLTVGEHTWNPALQSEHDTPFSHGLIGTRMGKLVYDTQEFAMDALYIFVLKAIDPSGKWIDEFLSENERSCMLKKNNTFREIPWTALIRKGGRVYISDVKEVESSRNIMKKSILMRT